MAQRYLTINVDEGTVRWEHEVPDVGYPTQYEQADEWAPIFAALRAMGIKGEIENWAADDEEYGEANDDGIVEAPKLDKQFVWDYGEDEGPSVVFDANGNRLGSWYASRGVWRITVGDDVYTWRGRLEKV